MDATVVVENLTEEQQESLKKRAERQKAERSNQRRCAGDGFGCCKSQRG